MTEGTRHRFDFSLRTVPDRWFDASRESGQEDVAPVLMPRTRVPVPHGQHADPVVATLGGLAMAVVAGASWFMLEQEGRITTAWVLVLVAALIGLSVRIAGGPYDPGLRATIAVMLYLVTALVVSFLVVRDQLLRADPDLSLSFQEEMFVRNRVLEIDHAAATLVGIWVAVRAACLRSDVQRPGRRPR